MGFTSSNPGSGSMAGRSSSVMVSPILVSATFLMLAIRNPTSPALRLVHFHWLRGEHAQGLHFENFAVPPQADLLAATERALENPRQHDDAAVRIEPGIEDQRLQVGFGKAFGRRHLRDDALQHLGDALAGLGADRQRVGGIEADGTLDHFLGAVHVGAGQVDLVDDGDDLEAVIDREICVGQRLRLHALGGVHHQQRALAGGQRARDLVGKIHVAGGVDQVELVFLAVARDVLHAHGVRLDGDAALALQVHGVEHLLLHLARRERSGELEQAVGQRALAVVDVGDDGEIADVRAVHLGGN